jgi:methylated-DNA-[protein]-cysteine S-methyltransferase
MIEKDGTLELDSPVGRLLLAASEEGLTHLIFLDHDGEPRRPQRRPTGDASPAVQSILAETEKQLGEYFSGRRREFDLPLEPKGTEFQLAVWNGLRDIPYGETESYGELARRVGHANAVRAVGAANGANPISIIVPCHRVIGRDGSLAGYGGGVDTKRALLQLEGAKPKEDRLF